MSESKTLLTVTKHLILLLLIGLAWGQNFSSQGYLRIVETSLCIDDCSNYALEDEVGNFINYISNDNDSIDYSNYVNRYIEIEGDSIFCVECISISVNNIGISYNCESPINCFVDPCSISNCYSEPAAECIADYCGGCWSDFYLNNELIQCDAPEGCIDLTGIDFGMCDMFLGIGWMNNHCESISGCDWVVDDVDYSEALFSSIDECEQSCIILGDIHNRDIPISDNILNNYPNPFNPITTLRYDLPNNGFVNITVYDMMGRVIKNLINTHQTAGYKTIQWNATNNQGEPVSAGVYLYKIQAGDFVDTKKMIFLK